MRSSPRYCLLFIVFFFQKSDTGLPQQLRTLILSCNKRGIITPDCLPLPLFSRIFIAVLICSFHSLDTRILHWTSNITSAYVWPPDRYPCTHQQSIQITDSDCQRGKHYPTNKGNLFFQFKPNFRHALCDVLKLTFRFTALNVLLTIFAFMSTPSYCKTSRHSNPTRHVSNNYVWNGSPAPLFSKYCRSLVNGKGYNTWCSRLQASGVNHPWTSNNCKRWSLTCVNYVIYV